MEYFVYRISPNVNRSPSLLFTEIKLHVLVHAQTQKWSLHQGTPSACHTGLDRMCPRDSRAGGPRLHLLGGHVMIQAMLWPLHPDAPTRGQLWLCRFYPFTTSLVAQTVKCLPTMWETQFQPWVGKIPWRRKWQPPPVLLPGKSHGRRNLVGYSPWGRRVGHDWATSLSLSSVSTTLFLKKSLHLLFTNTRVWSFSVCRYDSHFKQSSFFTRYLSALCSSSVSGLLKESSQEERLPVSLTEEEREDRRG